MKPAKIPDCTLLPAAGARAAANARPASESPLLPLPVRPRFPHPPSPLLVPALQLALAPPPVPLPVRRRLPRRCCYWCPGALGPRSLLRCCWRPELRLALSVPPVPLPMRSRLPRPPARLLVPALQLALAPQPLPLPVRRRPPAPLHVPASPFAPAALPLRARLPLLLIVSVPLAVVAGCPPTRLSFWFP